MRSGLVAAAIAVLQRDGASALTVRSITAEAGCSTTGIYTYFGGKQGLVEAIFVDGFEAFDAAIDPSLDAGDLPAAGRTYRRWALANQTQYMVMFGRAVPEYEPSDNARTRALMSFAKLAAGVAAVLADRHPERTDSIDAVAADRAYHVFATVHGYVMLELAGMAGATSDESERLYELAIEAVMQRVLA
jgi:AcrR family transcriptional regulator